ncbi:MAG: SWIM zinc finger family protein [Thermoguttaceae bacterium]|nr:SWIM zinc finger family protein [Thermoguttaceae bacterium]
MASKDSSPNVTRSDWLKLTWDDLDDWVGPRSVERGRRYQESGQVHELALTDDGKLLAWVQGGDRYATEVELLPERNDDAERLQSRCTCPVGFACKHAVAVVGEFLAVSAEGKEPPVVSSSDPRLERLRVQSEPVDDRTSQSDGELRDWLAAKPSAELVELVLAIADQFEGVAEELHQRRILAAGTVDTIVRRARREIQELTAEPVWYDGWHDEGSLPDYSRLQRLFEHLRDAGEVRALMELGCELMAEASGQLAKSHDEGDISGSVAVCLRVVFEAVLHSELPEAEKLLYAIQADLRDEYDLASGAAAIHDRQWPPEVWSQAADSLLQLISNSKPPDAGRLNRVHRDRETNWIVKALDRAGRRGEATRLCESEVRVTLSYERLVRRLIEEDRLDDAVRWAQEGAERTADELPGIAMHLREMLREIAAKRGQWPEVAAHYARDFFAQPDVSGFGRLVQAAAAAGCEDVVRRAALRFLETGKLPEAFVQVREGKSRERKSQKEWPLPVFLPAVPRAVPGDVERPRFDVLCRLAIAEKRPDDVLKWFDRIQEERTRSRSAYQYYAVELQHVADAVAATHPERALEIYRELAESLIARTQPSAYEEAAPHLKKARELLVRLDRGHDWTKLVEHLRREHSRKRRFIEVLDRLEGRMTNSRRPGRK